MNQAQARTRSSRKLERECRLAIAYCGTNRACPLGGPLIASGGFMSEFDFVLTYRLADTDDDDDDDDAHR